MNCSALSNPAEQDGVLFLHSPSFSFCLKPLHRIKTARLAPESRLSIESPTHSTVSPIQQLVPTPWRALPTQLPLGPSGALQGGQSFILQQCYEVQYLTYNRDCMCKATKGRSLTTFRDVACSISSSELDALRFPRVFWDDGGKEAV